MQIGDPITSQSFVATSGIEGRLEDFQGKWLILYFYPKDSTPGCTQEAADLRDLYPKFTQLNANIFGISRDSLKSHENFKAKQQLPFELISDKEEALCQQFDVIKMKSMYGKQVRGIERSTFLIDPKGILRQEWRKVSVKNHAQELLQALRQLQES
ncbi:peroxiredoxin [Legionella jordanis]|uniref:thioredoxin-dependent peroxiredoxin n=1 Tax=Legionella jordanis TaxID=456 RepID=A0A0W0VD81_9GAMM|nr:peroxiredoxin [Legionella jordanis]KTD18047.1 bacterioferritin comigratory protein [Legionella jordanis]RMX02269.1 peroxiredoxin [Legionella jordanis]RMX21246.1 peroxiredoxin [Legionella jordanis]VEH13861.1 bacterioferritin comigratory protein [Legionella jordanis]HAT8714242.1 redoxin domain-containing protein [Legionella jordanis]